MNKDNVIINVNIDLNDDLTNKYNKNIMNDELMEYIFNQCRGESLKKGVIINFISSIALSDDEKYKIKEMIRNNFSIKDVEDEILTKINRNRCMTFLIIGLFFIASSYIFKSFFLLSEFVLIIGWVAVWEVANYLLFEGSKNRINSKIIDQISRANIIFL